MFDQPGRIFLKRENPQVIRLITTPGTFESLNGGQTWSQKGDETKWPCGWPSFCYSIDTNNVRALGKTWPIRIPTTGLTASSSTAASMVAPLFILCTPTEFPDGLEIGEEPESATQKPWPF